LHFNYWMGSPPSVFISAPSSHGVLSFHSIWSSWTWLCTLLLPAFECSVYLAYSFPGLISCSVQSVDVFHCASYLVHFTEFISNTLFLFLCWIFLPCCWCFYLNCCYSDPLCWLFLCVTGFPLGPGGLHLLSVFSLAFWNLHLAFAWCLSPVCGESLPLRIMWPCFPVLALLCACALHIWSQSLPHCERGSSRWAACSQRFTLQHCST